MTWVARVNINEIALNEIRANMEEASASGEWSGGFWTRRDDRDSAGVTHLHQRAQHIKRGARSVVLTHP